MGQRRQTPPLQSHWRAPSRTTISPVIVSSWTRRKRGRINREWHKRRRSGDEGDTDWHGGRRPAPRRRIQFSATHIVAVAALLLPLPSAPPSTPASGASSVSHTSQSDRSSSKRRYMEQLGSRRIGPIRSPGRRWSRRAPVSALKGARAKLQSAFGGHRSRRPHRHDHRRRRDRSRRQGSPAQGAEGRWYRPRARYHSAYRSSSDSNLVSADREAEPAAYACAAEI